MLEAHKTGKFDKLILLSGDSDFVPAIELIQKEGAGVINLHVYAGSSKELRDTCAQHAKIEVETDGSVSLIFYTSA